MLSFDVIQGFNFTDASKFKISYKFLEQLLVLTKLTQVVNTYYILGILIAYELQRFT